MACACSLPALAQPTAQAPPGAAPLAFDVDLAAPATVQAVLKQHLDIWRYQTLGDLDGGEREQLAARAREQTAELLATMGFFVPTIASQWSPTTTETGAAAPLPKTSRPRLRLQVDTGPATHVSSVTLSLEGRNAHHVQAEHALRQAQARWMLPQGTPFSQAHWDTAKTQFRATLREREFATADVSHSQARVSDNGQQVELVVVITPGPAWRMGDLRITGLQRYGETLVERLAQLPPQAPYDREALLQARQRLVDSGFFDSVFVSLDTTSADPTAPVLVQLSETTLKKTTLGLGFTTDAGVRVSAEHIHRQIPGLGWRATTQLTADQENRAVNTEWIAPPDAALWRWNASARALVETVSGVSQTSQRLRAGRSQLSAEHDRNLYLQWDQARPIGIATTSDMRSISFNTAWTRRRLEPALAPDSGHGLGVELGAGSTLTQPHQPFVRGHVRWLGIWSPGGADRSAPGEAAGRMMQGRWVFRASAGGVGASSAAQIPQTQLFLTGGDTTVRGYARNTIGVPGTSGTPVPGRFMAAASAEWQFPLNLGSSPGEWQGAVFMDSGAVANRIPDLTAQTGTGAGLRWRSPVGPLHIDMARAQHTGRWRLHLNVGFVF